ncbi:MAG: deoxyhypusine synthase family protein [Magnetococcales bacterium]|nr:deoxyhypusine synthase family protein [Magnetococcales bacterium]
MMRDPDSYCDPVKDRLQTVKPVDLSRITTFDQLLTAYADASFGARRVGEAADVLEAMVRDQECFTVLTLSGAMTVAKMGLVIAEMVDRGYVDLIVSTGALMTHGLVESFGRHHYKVPPQADDAALYKAGLNRVYDTLEPESNLDEAETLLRSVLESNHLPDPWATHHLTEAIGNHLVTHFPRERGPLISTARQGVPVIIPAFTDSEMGLDVAVHRHRCRQAGISSAAFDPFLDLEFVTDQLRSAKRLGILTIGGGVPRNYAQQVGPFVEVLAHRTDGTTVPPVRYQYGIRICPDPAHLGGLSGCTYREGISWGKFVPPEEGGRYAEIPADATIVWPLIVKAVMERMEREEHSHDPSCL